MQIFTSVDPLAEDYLDVSSYVYCNANPIMLIDPDGMKPHPYPHAMLGEVTYYNWRLRDYLRQQPKGAAYPNSYYISYGAKYIKRFTYETSKTLSSAGQKWLKEVRKNLQEAIEARLMRKDGEQFEKNDKAFTEFAFKSHLKAYWNDKSGNTPLYDLPVLDLVKIVLTPDAKDLVSPNGREQVMAMAGMFADYFAANPGKLEQMLKDANENSSKIVKLIQAKLEKEKNNNVTVKAVVNAIRPLIPIHNP